MYLEERTYFPSDYDPDSRWDRVNVSHCVVKVSVVGTGPLYRVTSDMYNFIREDGEIVWDPDREYAREHLHYDFATACDIAERYIDQLRVGEYTFAELKSI